MRPNTPTTAVACTPRKRAARPADRLGRDPPLAVGWAGERQDHLLARDHVAHLDRVADGPDAPDRPSASARRRRCRRAGRAAAPRPSRAPVSGRTPMARMTRSAVRRAPRLGDADDAPSPSRLEAREPVAEVQRSRPASTRCSAHGLRHLGVERRHHLRQLLEHRHREPAVRQVLGHLEPDEPAADDERAVAAGAASIHDADADAVGDRAHGEDARAGRCPACGGPDRRRARATSTSAS